MQDVGLNLKTVSYEMYEEDGRNRVFALTASIAANMALVSGNLVCRHPGWEQAWAIYAAQRVVSPNSMTNYMNDARKWKVLPSLVALFLGNLLCGYCALFTSK